MRNQFQHKKSVFDATQCNAPFQAFDILLRKLQKNVPYGASVTDLYAGAGVIGLSLAATRKCRQELNNYKWSEFAGRILISKWKTYLLQSNFILFSRSVKCVEINKESKLSFEKTVSRLPKSVESSISWHNADTAVVSVWFSKLNYDCTHIRIHLRILYLKYLSVYFYKWIRKVIFLFKFTCMLILQIYMENKKQFMFEFHEICS